MTHRGQPHVVGGSALIQDQAQVQQLDSSIDSQERIGRLDVTVHQSGTMDNRQRVT